MCFHLLYSPPSSKYALVGNLSSRKVRHLTKPGTARTIIFSLPAGHLLWMRDKSASPHNQTLCY